MVALKSPREIETMRRSGKITSKVLADLMKAARPGMTTSELDGMAEKGIRELGGVPTFKGYHGFPASICASVDDEVVHGIPGPRVLRDGDLLSIDIGTTFEGYVSDSAATVPIGNVSQAAQRLMAVTQECLMIGIAQMQRGKRVGDIGAAVQAHAEKNGYGVVRELVGHGVGRAMHEEPQVPNYGKPGTGVELRPGLVLAIEPMITQGAHAVKILKDGWTVVTADGKLAAHFEHTIAVTDDGPKILTLRDFAEHPDADRYRPAAEAVA
ncbi:MAG: type I methionyl aminopeptidase [Candidatus Eremiobacteraeota bacterium]|nr:type I methionyl aminopeptidase [Candidatus Eremiobacteraeota bacterium]MBV8284292.1 type I methionyl aminopeptidase [Candidatus Eremiobacteraeota bacterium]MBV8434635.1 type I methionyl aminopeptidase [Candidatus Eremiobacteraeota bacterium]